MEEGDQRGVLNRYHLPGGTRGTTLSTGYPTLPTHHAGLHVWTGTYYQCSRKLVPLKSRQKTVLLASQDPALLTLTHQEGTSVSEGRQRGQSADTTQCLAWDGVSFLMSPDWLMTEEGSPAFPRWYFRRGQQGPCRHSVSPGTTLGPTPKYPGALERNGTFGADTGRSQSQHGCLLLLGLSMETLRQKGSTKGWVRAGGPGRAGKPLSCPRGTTRSEQLNQSVRTGEGAPTPCPRPALTLPPPTMFSRP